MDGWVGLSCRGTGTTELLTLLPETCVPYPEPDIRPGLPCVSGTRSCPKSPIPKVP